MKSSHEYKAKTPWRLIFVVVVLIVVVAFLPAARSQGMHKGHEHFHDDFYQKWEQSNGRSCCNSKSRHANGDCAPLDSARLRTRNEDVQVLIGTEWVTVAPEKIRPYFAPDFSNHLCNQGTNVLCLVIGGGT